MKSQQAGIGPKEYQVLLLVDVVQIVALVVVAVLALVSRAGMQSITIVMLAWAILNIIMLKVVALRALRLSEGASSEKQG